MAEIVLGDTPLSPADGVAATTSVPVEEVIRADAATIWGIVLGPEGGMMKTEMVEEGAEGSNAVMNFPQPPISWIRTVRKRPKTGLELPRSRWLAQCRVQILMMFLWPSRYQLL